MSQITFFPYEKYAPDLVQQGVKPYPEFVLFEKYCPTILDNNIRGIISAYVIESHEPMLYRLLHIAADAMRTMNEWNFISPNYLNRDNPRFVPNTKYYDAIMEQDGRQRADINKKYNAIRHGTEFDKVFLYAESLKAARQGNCNFLSAFYFFYLYERLLPLRIKVVMFGIINGNHIGLLMTPQWENIISDPATWGKEGVIFDAWAKKFFPASEYLQKLKVYEEGRRPGLALLRDFRPYHTIGRITTNYLSLVDFEEIVEDADERALAPLKQLLGNFLRATDLTQQKEAALAILRFSSFIPIQDASVVFTLFAQMKYFLKVLEGYRFVA